MTNDPAMMSSSPLRYAHLPLYPLLSPFLVGLMILAGAQSAIHEIEAFLLFLIAAVFLVGVAIVDAIESQRK